MPQILRPAAERGHADHGWLNSRHSFSFADYYDARHMGFGALRVINDDLVAPAMGFGTHGHRDMEIISYVVDGALEHRDSIGTGSVIRRGDVQVMSAGTGIRHSEFNPSASEPVRFLQIWLLPEAAGLAPRYDQKTFTATDKGGRLCLIASPDGRQGSLLIRQNADVYAAILNTGDVVRHNPASDRRVWIQMISGSARINALEITAGDGLAVTAEASLTMTAKAMNSEFLMFDLI